MKITEMYDDDIVKLTDEQLDLLIKVECMEQGIPIEPKPPESSFFEIPKTVTGFCVTGCNFWLEKREDAQRIAALLNEMRTELRDKKYTWQTGYDVEWLENYEQEIKLEEKFFYDKLQVQDKEALLVKRKTLKEQYEADKSKYEKSREKVRKISDSIYGLYYEARKESDYYEARKESERVARYKTIFAEYLALANNDAEAARAFFDKAYKEQIEEKTYAKLFPDNPQSGGAGK